MTNLTLNVSTAATKNYVLDLKKIKAPEFNYSSHLNRSLPLFWEWGRQCKKSVKGDGCSQFAWDTVHVRDSLKQSESLDCSCNRFHPCAPNTSCSKSLLLTVWCCIQIACVFPSINMLQNGKTDWVWRRRVAAVAVLLLTPFIRRFFSLY